MKRKQTSRTALALIITIIAWLSICASSTAQSVAPTVSLRITVVQNQPLPKSEGNISASGKNPGIYATVTTKNLSDHDVSEVTVLGDTGAAITNRAKGWIMTAWPLQIKRPLPLTHYIKRIYGIENANQRDTPVKSSLLSQIIPPGGESTQELRLDKVFVITRAGHYAVQLYRHDNANSSTTLESNVAEFDVTE